MNFIDIPRKRFYLLRKNLYKSWKYPKGGLIFKLRFGLKKQLKVHAGNVSVFFDTSSDFSKRFFFPYYQNGESLEPSVMAVLIRRIRSNSVFLDIGAFLGSYAVVASRFCPQGSVHAFEMSPRSICELRKNVLLNKIKNINLICAAVWDETGVPKFFDNAIDNDHTTNSINPAGGCNQGVMSLRIDGYCDQMRIKPDLVKIDVEGAEVRVLRGMERTLDSVQTIFLEIHPFWLSRYDTSMEELAGILRRHGFSVQAVMNRRENKDAVLLPVDDLLQLHENLMLICERSPSAKKK